MRIASLNIMDIKDINSRININFNKSVFTDLFKGDFEEFSYCMDTRIYDIVFITYEDFLSKKYFNVFKYFLKNNKDTKVYLFLNNQKSYPNYNYFIDTIKTCYADLQIEMVFLDNINIEVKLLNFIVEKVDSYFLDFLNISFVENFYVNNVDNNRILQMVISGNIIEIKLDNDIDFNMLIFFIKNYGNIVTLRSITSAITKVPENTSDSKIENSISKIRKKLLFFNNFINIQNFKKAGYKIIVNNG